MFDSWARQKFLCFVVLLAYNITIHDNDDDVLCEWNDHAVGECVVLNDKSVYDVECVGCELDDKGV